MIPLGLSLPPLAALFVLLVRHEVRRARSGGEDVEWQRWERVAVTLLALAATVVVVSRLSDVAG